MKSPEGKIPQAKKVFPESITDKQWRPGIRRTGEKSGLTMESKSAHEKSSDEVHVKPENQPSPEEEKQKLKSLVEQFPANIWGLDENYVKSSTSESTRVESGNVWGLSENYDKSKPSTLNENVGTEHATSSSPEMPVAQPASASAENATTSAQPTSEAATGAPTPTESTSVNQAPIEPAPAGYKIPEWRKLGRNDELLNEPTAAAQSAIGRNRHIERASNGGSLDQAAFREYLKNQKEREALVEKRRDARSEKFAKDFPGLTEIRNAKLAAEKEAYEIEKDFHRNISQRFSLTALRKRDETLAKANRATLEWNKALQNLPEGATQRQRMEALIIRKRDTIIGPNALRMKAREDALNDRDKTTLGKVQNWFMSGGLLKLPLQAYSGISKGVGAGLYKLFGNKNLTGDALERSKAKWRRAGQILTGATIGTAAGILLAPGTVGAMGGALGYAGYLSVRSLLGITAGGAAAKGAGALNKITFDKSTKHDYRNEVRNTGVHSTLDLERQQRAEKHGSRTARKKREQAIKVGTAAVVGGLTSFELGQFAHLPSVQHAVHDHQHPPTAPEHPKTPPTQNIEKQMQIGGKNAEGVTINNADRLFGHFGLLLKKDFASVAHPPQAVDTYLKAITPPNNGDPWWRGEDHFSTTFGFEGKYPLSEVMHNGDTIKLTNSGAVVIDWADHTRPEHILINPDGSINKDLGDIAEHMKAVHEHAQQHLTEAVDKARAAASPETAPVATPVTETAPDSDHADVGLNNAEHQADLQQPESTAPAAQPESTTPEPPQAEAPQPIPEVVPTPELSGYYYDPNLYGGHEVFNTVTRRPDLAFYYNPQDEHFMERLQEFARQHPGREVRFESPEPTLVNGRPEPWIATGVYDPRGGFSAQAVPSPGFAGTRLDPSAFTRRIR